MDPEPGQYLFEDILPLSPLQEGLLFHALYEPAVSDIYSVQQVFDLEGPIDSEVLEAAAQAVLRRHASLRAGFQHEELSRPVQTIASNLTVPWKRIDLSSLRD